MSKIDLYSPQWVEMVFADKNKAYGAYQLRMGTTKRNIWSIVIMAVLAAILVAAVGINSMIEAQKAKERYEAEMIASKLAEQEAKKKQETKKEEAPKVQPKIEQKVVPETRATQQFTPPVIKKDNEVKQDKMLTMMDKLKEDVAVGSKNQEGTNDRTDVAAKSDVTTVAPPPPPAPEPVKEEPKQEVKAEVENKVFDVVEQQPQYPGGPSAMMSYLSSNIKYPAAAAENGIQGRVVVQFVVEKNGSVSDVRVVKSVDPSLDKEAIRVVSGMRNWTPGKQNGQSVRCKFTLPVQFKLQ